MVNMTRAIFRSGGNRGGVKRDKPELPVRVCVTWKKSCFTRLVIVQNRPVIYQSRSNRWRARISQTRKKNREWEGDSPDADGVRKRDTGGVPDSRLPYFLPSKNGGLSAERPAGAIFTCRPSKQITAVVRMRRNDLHHSTDEGEKLGDETIFNTVILESINIFISTLFHLYDFVLNKYFQKNPKNK